MKFKDLRLHRWPLGLTLGLSLAFFSCATTSQVKVTAEVIDPGQAANRSVMVVPDSFMSDTAEADVVAELVRGKLAALGFQINDIRGKGRAYCYSDSRALDDDSRFENSTQDATSVRYFPRDGTNQLRGISTSHAKAWL